MQIEIEFDFRADVVELLNSHLQSMAEQSPPESMHALDVSELQADDVTFWCARDESGVLMGCGAIKQLDSGHAEIKSMKTSDDFLRQGVAAAILERILDVAKTRSYKRLSLETGSVESFAAAQKLYERYGFEECEPFADYVIDPNSLFMTRVL